MYERELFREYYGPFDNTTIVVFEEIDGIGFRLSFDEGPEFNVGRVLSDTFPTFKILPGYIAEIRVTLLFGRFFSFQGKHLVPLASSVVRTSAATVPGAAAPICFSLHCDDTWPCPDPTKPVLVCDGGKYECRRGEAGPPGS